MVKARVNIRLSNCFKRLCKAKIVMMDCGVYNPYRNKIYDKNNTKDRREKNGNKIFIPL